MAIPVARVHLAMAHAALPALLPTPPKWKMLLLLPTPPCIAAAILPKPPLASIPISRADFDERWDECKTKPAPASAEPSSSPVPRPTDNVIRSRAGRHGSSSSPRKNATTSPQPPKPGRADSMDRWDADKMAASPPASSSSPSSGSGTSPLVSSGNDDIDDTEEEEIVWKPRAMYSGPGFVVAAPESSVLPMPTALFLVPVA